jgi:hypothetical protein
MSPMQDRSASLSDPLPFSASPPVVELTWDAEHPAVLSAVSTVDPGQSLRVRGAVIREPAAVVLLADDRTRRAVILTEASGVWTPPTMPGGRTWDPADRPAETPAPWALTQPVGPGPGGAPPRQAWTALTDLTAADAVSVLVRSELDEHEVAVPDGVTLALLRVPWGSPPDITVRNAAG